MKIPTLFAAPNLVQAGMAMDEAFANRRRYPKDDRALLAWCWSVLHAYRHLERCKLYDELNPAVLDAFPNTVINLHLLSCIVWRAIDENRVEVSRQSMCLMIGNDPGQVSAALALAIIKIKEPDTYPFDPDSLFNRKRPTAGND